MQLMGSILAYFELEAALNPIDYKLADGSIKMLSKFPAIVGFSGAGVIVAVGSGVLGYEVGDRVYETNPAVLSRFGIHRKRLQHSNWFIPRL